MLGALFANYETSERDKYFSESHRSRLIQETFDDASLRYQFRTNTLQTIDNDPEVFCILNIRLLYFR